MEYAEAVRRLTPCGLDCERCADYSGGKIGRLSRELLERLGNYGRVACMKAEGRPEFADYGAFEAILRTFAEGSCDGCRSDRLECPIACPFADCRGKGVDFCFQCAEYPCEKLQARGFAENMRRRNDRMKEIGVIAYLDERMKEPRYP